MAKHAFLSKEWVEAAQQIRTEQFASENAPSVSFKMNLVVEEVPFGDGRIDAHVDTSGGSFDIATGHLDEADVTINLDYETAKAILVGGDSQAGMAAFMAGKVRVEGDMTKLLSYQSQPPSERQRELNDALKSITA